jgi:dolichol-phosphate mannosyltransferase
MSSALSDPLRLARHPAPMNSDLRGAAQQARTDREPTLAEVLYVVIPVFNEEASVAGVIREWSATLVQLGINYRLLVVNDGSRDGTAEVLERQAADDPLIEVIEKPNSGHGQTCIFGYRSALDRGANWVFQIDSDGQCDPRHFAQLWEKRVTHPVVFGRRTRRDDGLDRRLISWFCSIATKVASGVTVRDPNVPYRLMRADFLRCAIESFPEDIGLANVLLSVVLQKGLGQRTGYVDIGFRERHGGMPSVRWSGFANAGLQLFRSLRNYRQYALNRARVLAYLPTEKP